MCIGMVLYLSCLSVYLTDCHLACRSVHLPVKRHTCNWNVGQLARRYFILVSSPTAMMRWHTACISALHTSEYQTVKYAQQYTPIRKQISGHLHSGVKVTDLVAWSHCELLECGMGVWIQEWWWMSSRRPPAYEKHLSIIFSLTSQMTP